MQTEAPLTRQQLTTPRAAAVAGILFSVLLITSLVLIQIAVPASPQDLGTWLSSGWRTVSLALNLLPFAGIASLWFIGVVRDRLGQHEDRWAPLVFALWVLLISVHILLANLGRSQGGDATSAP